MRTFPSRDADEIEWVSFEQSGVLSTEQAVALLGRSAVRGHLTAGRWRCVCRGILATHNGTLTRDQKLWVAVLAAGRAASLAGTTALVAAGVRGVRDQTVHVLIPIDRKRSSRLPGMPADMPAVRVVRTRVLPEEHLQVARPPRTTTARAAVDAAAWARNGDEAAAILAATCQQGRATPEEMFDVLRIRRRLPRRAMIRKTLLDIAGGAQSLSEINFFDLCVRFKLPLPDLQERRVDAGGRHRFLDAYWRSRRLHVEVDGAHHMSAGQWADDMVRQNDVWIKGDRILRFPARMVRSRPAQVAGQLYAALTAAGWRPDS